MEPITYDNIGKLFARVTQLEADIQGLREWIGAHTHDRLLPEDRPMPATNTYEGAYEVSDFPTATTRRRFP